MGARATPDLSAPSWETTASLWRPMAMRGAGNKGLRARQISHFDLVRNVYSEKSKADDVQFILDLITKIGAEIPAADMNNVNIAGQGSVMFKSLSTMR